MSYISGRREYMLIKVVCHFPCTSPYMAACMSFYCDLKKPGNDAQLRWLGPLSTQDALHLIKNFKL